MRTILLLLLFVGIPLFAVENLIIERDEFTKTLTPNSLSTQVVIKRENSQDQNIIIRDLNMLNDRLKGGQKVCDGGGVSIYPEYSYEDRKREFLGYRGESIYSCNFENIEDFEISYGIIQEFFKENDKYKIEISPLTWNLEAQEIEIAQKELINRAILQGYARAKELTKLTKESCFVTKTDFTQNSHYIRQRSTQELANSTTPNEPIKRDEVVKIIALYEFICR